MRNMDADQRRDQDGINQHRQHHFAQLHVDGQRAEAVPTTVRAQVPRRITGSHAPEGRRLMS